ncbi:MAG: filamentous hemagglutinin N-terminal domain-containing protein [Phormidesmis sp.]
MMNAIAPWLLRRCNGCFILLAIFGMAFGDRVAAQIVPDETLGSESSQVESDGTVDLMIRGGSQQQENWFHSFERFSINEGQRAYFDTPTDVVRIFSRVTGEAPSDIFGTLGVNGSADLFLINPNGIVFGSNAQLEIDGSFAAIASDRLTFPNGSEFATTTPADSLLTLSVPLGLQFNAQPTGDIASTGNLAVGQTLTLVGNRLLLGGALTAGASLNLTDVVSPDGLMLFAGGDVAFSDYTGGAIQVESSGNISFNSIDTSNRTGKDGESIFLLAAGNISAGSSTALTLGSQFETLDSSSESENGNSGNGGSVTILSTSGDIAIEGDVQTQSVSFSSSEFNNSTPGSSGNGGDVTISAESGDILIAGSLYSGSISDATPDLGGTTSGSSSNGGNIAITATSGDINIEGGLFAYSLSVAASYSEAVTSGRSGNGGNILLSSTTGDISVRKGDDGERSINSSSISYSISFFDDALSGDSNSGNSINISEDSGNGGNINISSVSGDIDVRAMLASESATWSDSFSESEASISGDSGSGGSVAVSSISGDIALKNDIQTSATSVAFSNSGLSTSGNSGDGGDVVVSSVSGDIALLGGDSLSSFDEAIFLLNNKIDTTSRSISELSPVLESDRALASSANSSNGGDITISSTQGDIAIAGELLSFSQTFAESLSSVVSGDSGDGGSITVSAPAGSIQSSTAPGSKALSNRGQMVTFSMSLTGQAGTGGDVSLEAAEAISGIDISTLSSHAASGNVKIRGFQDNLSISNLRLITSGLVEVPNPYIPSEPFILNLDDFGQAGNALIESPGDIVLDDVSIQSSANGSQPAGGVTIVSPAQVILKGSQIISNANSTGDAGEIRIDAGQLTLDDNSSLSASTSSSGLAGNIELSAADTLEIRDSTVTSSTEENSTALGGNIRVMAPTSTLRNSSIEVDSQGTGQSGTVTIVGDQLILANRSRVNATTRSSNGGDLTFNLEDLLLLRGNSEISTTAGTASAGGDGGDVIVNTQFVIATPDENNNIAANAFDGDGGSVNVAATGGIFGITPRPSSTAFSDITASSENGISGTVSIQSPNIDPTQSLDELPVALAEPEVVRSCQEMFVQSGSKFIISGRGGLPQGPLDSTATALWQDVLPIENAEEGDVVPDTVAQNTVDTINNSTERNTTVPIVEAQGFGKNEKGETVLLATVSQPLAADHGVSCER